MHGNLTLEKILESMEDAFVNIDREWRYTYANSKALKLMSKQKEELIGKVLWDVFPDKKGTIFEIEYGKAMHDNLPISFESYYPSNSMWFEVQGYPHDEGVAIAYTDITKYKKAEEVVKSFNQILEQRVTDRTMEMEFAIKELEAFSYSISHDLRAPLRAIDGYMKIIIEEHSGELSQEAIALINRASYNSRRMGQLIDDLLEFSRLGRKNLVKGNMSMKRVVMEVWEDLIKQENRSIEFKLQELPNIVADSIAMKQVWINLIANAIKYTSLKENASINIGFTEEDKSIVYHIKDNGDGFDMRFANKLFGVFQRLHSLENFEGTGVGLAIVHRVVTKHGGKVWAESQLDSGATFYISLPKE